MTDTEPEIIRNTPNSSYGYNDGLKGAQVIIDGSTLDWQPGDATRYELLVAGHPNGRRFLICTNIEFFVELPKHFEPQPHGWWVQRLPRGTWAGLRPLLVGLGLAQGELATDCVYRSDDGRREWELRSGSDYKEGSRKMADRSAQQDRLLGRSVREVLGKVGLAINADKLDALGREIEAQDDDAGG